MRILRDAGRGYRHRLTIEARLFALREGETRFSARLRHFAAFPRQLARRPLLGYHVLAMLMKSDLALSRI